MDGGALQGELTACQALQGVPVNVAAFGFGSRQPREVIDVADVACIRPQEGQDVGVEPMVEMCVEDLGAERVSLVDARIVVVAARDHRNQAQQTGTGDVVGEVLQGQVDLNVVEGPGDVVLREDGGARLLVPVVQVGECMLRTQAEPAAE